MAASNHSFNGEWGKFLKVRMDIIYKTKSGNQYPVEILYKEIETDLIPYNRELTLAACKNGCSLYGRNGGCPPFSPDFLTFRLKYPSALIILAKMRTEYFPEKVLKGPYYVRWVFVETTISRFLDRLGRKMAEKRSSKIRKG